MRAKFKIVSSVLTAVLMFGFALTARAQVSHQVSSTPVGVVKTGLAEVLGEVMLTKTSIPANSPQTTIGGTINVLYQGVPIANLFSGSIPIAGGVINDPTSGITIEFSGDWAAAAGITAQVTNTPAGGLVTISIPAGIVIVTDGSAITINGVRGSVVLAPSDDVQAVLSATPSNAHSYVNVSTVTVARRAQGLVVDPTLSTTSICLDPNDPTVSILEGFPGAFVQHVTAGGGVPNNARPVYGATNNTNVRITLTGLPTGVGVDWPDTVNSVTGSSTARLLIIDESDSEATYQFWTTDQANSDTLTEQFIIMPTLTVDRATAVPGTATLQATLEPAESDTNAIPRFREELLPNPGEDFIRIIKCTTNLLFPFLANTQGYDSGIAIANTTVDPYGTIAQSGAITLYGYPQFASGSTAPTPITTVLTTNLEAGNTYAASLSGITGLAGFQGYAIVICEFQYGHGYAFISGNSVNGVPSIAEGYLAEVIPDPTLYPDSNGNPQRFARPPLDGDQSGESLSN
jgi:hypothetical protein